MAETSAMMISQCNVDFLKVNRAYLTGLQCSYSGRLLGDLQPKVLPYCITQIHTGFRDSSFDARSG